MIYIFINYFLRFIIFSLVIIKPNCIYAFQDVVKVVPCCDSVKISGYMVFVYLKGEVKENRKNISRRNKGKSYSYQIDENRQSFFIPLDSIINEKEFIYVTERFVSSGRNQLFEEFPSLDVFGFEKFRLNCLNNIKSSHGFPSFSSNKFYVFSGRQSKYCFKIFYLNAIWAKIALSQDATFELITKKAKYMDSTRFKYDIFILREMYEYNSNPNLKKYPVKVWKTIEPFW